MNSDGLLARVAGQQPEAALKGGEVFDDAVSLKEDLAVPPLECPMINLTVVLLPASLGPTWPGISTGRMVKLTSSRAGMQL
jgi:hypothetical protein